MKAALSSYCCSVNSDVMENLRLGCFGLTHDWATINNDFSPAVIADLAIDLGCAGTGMTQALLHLAQIRPCTEQMRGKAVAKRVGRNRRLNTNLLHIVFDEQPQTLTGEPLTPMVEKER